ncbi:MAG TPA: hypothetical protein VKZ53_21545 [Candidatus Angelobacter sp.]|nr:hypothetical protein [Candidatus Angelobacter sp.]
MLQRAIALLFLSGLAAFGQEPSPQPQVRLNILNVCTPSAEEQGVVKSVLDEIPAKPAFIQDFEITRGLATMKDAPASKFVRLRREFPADSLLLTAQYSVSIEEDELVELLVLRHRDSKDFHEIALEDRISADSASPSTVFTTDTPVTHLKIERFGKKSVGLSRCPNADQSVYEPLFSQASMVMANFRRALGLRNAFRTDLTWLTEHGKPAASPSPRKQP